MSEPVKAKKSAWQIVLYILAGLGLVFIALVAYSFWDFHNRFIGRSRSSAAQNFLYQLALAQVAYCTDTGRYFTDWEAPLQYGFRPDPNVRVKLVVIDLDIYGYKFDSFLAMANHATGKKVYSYDIISGMGVTELPRAKPLGEEYAFHIERPDGYNSNHIVIKNGGPPITPVWLRLPLPGQGRISESEERP